MSTETEPPKVEIFGFAEEESEEPVTLRPNRFRPQAGIRSRLRNRLHEVLEEEEEDDNDDEKPSNSPRYVLLHFFLHITSLLQKG